MKRNLRCTSGLAALLLALALLAGCNRALRFQRRPAAEASAQQTEQTGQREVTRYGGAHHDRTGGDPVAPFPLDRSRPFTCTHWFPTNCWAGIMSSMTSRRASSFPSIMICPISVWETRSTTRLSSTRLAPRLPSMSPRSNEGTKDEADQLSQQLGVPVVMVSSERGRGRGLPLHGRALWRGGAGRGPGGRMLRPSLRM